ncbi:hypothetical protein FRB93_000763 [Tulasnella sp. JGI-2019a]|nr:hypothetical protein FRB93_000763 [Tulasnella sp. JGI-2019a]
MSNPTDNTTTPEQTQGAQAYHSAYHKGCAAYSAWYNATLSSSVVPSSTSTSSTPTFAPVTSSNKTNIAPIVGGAVGGFFGLILILAILFLVYRYMQNKHEETIEGTAGRMSIFSGGGFRGEIGQYEFEVGTAPTGVTPIAGSGNIVGGNSGVASGVTSPESTWTPLLNQNPVPTFNLGVMSPYQDDMGEFRGSGSGSLSPAPMYQPQPQRPPPDWRESFASSGAYDTSMGSRYDTSMGQHSPTSPIGPSQPPTYGSGNDIILEGQGGPRSSIEKHRV